MAQATMIFPPDFRWGTATASFQVEGNNSNSDWWQWEQQPGAILHGDRSGLAADWWANAEADLDRAAGMGTNAHRLSLEWSRIEPEPSVFDDQALDRYRQILQGMHQRGIEPMVTLHHFSNPLWLVEKGDFGSELIVDYFRRYAAKAASSLGDLVPKWVTINEPMTYVLLRYLKQDFPRPQQDGWSAAWRALAHMLQAHAAAYHAIKELYPAAEVGVAKHRAILEPAHPGNPLARWWTRRLSYLFNDLWLDCTHDGRLRWPVGRGVDRKIAGTFDFAGINYYTRFYTNFPPFGGLYRQEWGPEATISDGNYGEVYPSGLFQAIKAVLPYQKPIYITENGLPDADDDIRPAFIATHLRELWRAVSFNYPVMGYYHWSLVDNFEWHQGWSLPFGLIALDPATQERQLRPSGQLYGEICRRGGLSSELVARFAPSVLELLFPGQK